MQNGRCNRCQFELSVPILYRSCPMPPTLLRNRYRVLQILHSGGFGQIFLAEDTHLPSRRPCVIKQIKPVATSSPVQRLAQEEFEQKAAVLERLSRLSSHLPKLYTYFVEDGRFYLVQEWIDGETLAHKAWRQGRFSEAEVRQLLAEVLPVLSDVHSQGIIHQDIKPENIVVRHRDGKFVLMNFGLVQAAVNPISSIISSTNGQTDGDMPASIATEMPDYRPPEQATGKLSDASDLYSLGMTVIALLTARPPHHLIDPVTGNMIWRHEAPTISDHLAAVLNQAIQFDASDRYASAQEMLARLNAHSSVSAAFPARSPGITPAGLASAAPLEYGNLQTRLPDPNLGSSSVQSAPQHRFMRSTLGKISRTSTILSLAIFGVAAGIGYSAYHGLFANRPLVNPPSAASIERPSPPLMASEQAPTAQALYDRGTIKSENGNAQAAIIDYTEAININPEFVEAYFARAKAYDALGRHLRAIQDFTKVIDLVGQTPAASFAYTGRCLARYKNGDAQAIEDCTLAISIDPTNSHAYLAQGRVRYGLRDLEGAIENYTEAITLTPDFADAYLNRGMAHKELGNSEDAIADLRKAAALFRQENNQQGYAQARQALHDLE